MIAGTGCSVKYESPEPQLVGTWSVWHDFVTDSLVLASDGSFLQSLAGRDHRRLRATGRWRREYREVVLDRAYSFHTLRFDDFEETLEETRIHIAWEWGRMVLSFDPDVEGFTRRGPPRVAR